MAVPSAFSGDRNFGRGLPDPQLLCIIKRPTVILGPRPRSNPKRAVAPCSQIEKYALKRSREGVGVLPIREIVDVTTLRTRIHLQAISFISFDFHESKGLPVEEGILAPKL